MLSYVAPLGLAFEGVLLYVGFHPTLVYFALTGLAWCVCRVFVGASPYAVLFRPFGAGMVCVPRFRRGEPLRSFISPLRGLH